MKGRPEHLDNLLTVLEFLVLSHEAVPDDKAETWL